MSREKKSVEVKRIVLLCLCGAMRERERHKRGNDLARLR
jgi:hypothetical protein